MIARSGGPGPVSGTAMIEALNIPGPGYWALEHHFVTSAYRNRSVQTRGTGIKSEYLRHCVRIRRGKLLKLKPPKVISETREVSRVAGAPDQNGRSHTRNRSEVAPSWPAADTAARRAGRSSFCQG